MGKRSPETKSSYAIFIAIASTLISFGALYFSYLQNNLMSEQTEIFHNQESLQTKQFINQDSIQLIQIKNADEQLKITKNFNEFQNQIFNKQTNLLDIQTHLVIKPKLSAVFTVKRLTGNEMKIFSSQDTINGISIINSGSIPINKIDIAYTQLVYGINSSTIYVRDDGSRFDTKIIYKKPFKPDDTIHFPIKRDFIKMLVMSYESLSDWPKNVVKDNDLLVEVIVIKIRYFHYLDNSEYTALKTILCTSQNIAGRITPFIYSKDTEFQGFESREAKIVNKLEDLERNRTD